MTHEHENLHKFHNSGKISRFLRKNSTTLVDFFSKKHNFLTYFVHILDRDEGIPWWFWTTQGFQKNTLFWKIPYYIAVKFDHIGRIFHLYTSVFLKKGRFFETLETIWWVSLKPSKVSYFFMFWEILRFLRKFGGFIAKMSLKMTKMRVSFYQKPASISQKPVPISRKPVSISRKPLPISRKPVSNFREPIPISRKPISIFQKPVPIFRKPVSNSRKLAPVSRKTIPISRKPVSNSRKPVPISQKPVPIIRKPI